MDSTRRTFLKLGSASAIAAVGSACSTLRPKQAQDLALGFDNFSIRAFKWNATQLLDYAEKNRVDSLLLSDLDVYESFDPAYLNELGARAQSLDIELQAGTGSICGASGSFKDKHGSDLDHLKLSLKVANHLGSKVVRCYQGSSRDRKLEGGLAPLIDRTVTVCKSVESLAKDLNVKIAIENHSGDLTAWQLKQLIERAGPDYVGATIDAGNAAVTLEDPIENLRILGPYVLSSGIRDTAFWKSDKGTHVWWKAMGSGSVDWPAYFKLWRELCPQAPVQLEIISQWGRTFPPKSDDAFWKNYPDIRDVDYSAFMKRAALGTPPPEAPEERFSKEFMQKDLEQSLAYCHSIGLGIKNR